MSTAKILHERSLEEAASALSEEAIHDATREQLELMGKHHLEMRRVLSAFVTDIQDLESQ